MQYTRLPRTDITVSRIAFGCMSTVRNPTYEGVEQQQAIATIHAACDAGVTLFDTAPSYGNGASEELLGRALRGRRDRVVIATKASGSTLSPEEISRDCDASLARLQTDYIDLYQIHWPRRVTPLDETMRALETLKTLGKVRALGVCNFGPLDMAEAFTVVPFATNQVAYSLLSRAPEISIAELCLAQRVGVLCYSPLAQGLLTGRFRSAADVPPSRARTRHFTSAGRPQVNHGGAGCERETFAAIAGLAATAEEFGQSMSALALAWLLHQPIVTAVLAGASRPDQVAANVAAADLKLSVEQLDQLDDITRPVKEKLGGSLDLWMTNARTR